MPSNERQLELPLTRRERIDSIDGIDPRLAGINPRSWRTCRDMLKQIEYCSSGNDSSVYVETLAARLAVDRSTVLRAADKLEASGLLQIETRYGGATPGRSSNGWRIRYPRVLACQKGAEIPPAESVRDATHKLRDATHNVRDATHKMQDATHNPANLRRKSVTPRGVAASVETPTSVLSPLSDFRSSNGGDEFDDQKNLGEQNSAGLDGQAIRRQADAIVARIGPCRQARDWDLAAKAAVLALRFGENWLWDAVNGVCVKRERLNREGKSMRRPWGVLHKYLETWTQQQLGLPFNGLLAATVLPPAAATWRGGKAWGRRESLCVATREPVA